MKLTIKNETEQPLLSRKQIDAEVLFEGPSPSRKNVAAELAAKASVKPELLVVFKIDIHFGSQKAKVTAYAYTDKDAMSKIEETKKFKRTGFKEPEKPKEEAKEESKSEEKPAEEKKEEPKAEEAKE